MKKSLGSSGPISRAARTLVLTALLVGVPALALAHGSDSVVKTMPTVPSPSVSLGAGGEALVRGARVTSVSGTSIVAIQNWGSSSLTWTIALASTTQVLASDARTPKTLANVAVGDIVSASGSLDQSKSAFALKADVVRDWNIVPPVVATSTPVRPVVGFWSHFGNAFKTHFKFSLH